jgi:two-component system response regulator
LLLVEDNADDLFFLTRLLKQAEATNPLYVASDGEEAVELLERVRQGDPAVPMPLVAFVDIKMPRMDGFELLRWIRGNGELDCLAVVMLSSSSEARDVARAAELGAQYFFAKHPSPATITQVLAAAEKFARVSNRARRAPEVPSSLLPLDERR